MALILIRQWKGLIPVRQGKGSLTASESPNGRSESRRGSHDLASHGGSNDGVSISTRPCHVRVSGCGVREEGWRGRGEGEGPMRVGAVRRWDCALVGRRCAGGTVRLSAGGAP
eukprot:5536021-Prymnesium_polylepis.1